MALTSRARTWVLVVTCLILTVLITGLAYFTYAYTTQRALNADYQAQRDKLASTCESITPAEKTQIWLDQALYKNQDAPTPDDLAKLEKDEKKVCDSAKDFDFWGVTPNEVAALAKAVERAEKLVETSTKYEETAHILAEFSYAYWQESYLDNQRILVLGYHAPDPSWPITAPYDDLAEHFKARTKPLVESSASSLEDLKQATAEIREKREALRVGAESHFASRPREVRSFFLGSLQQDAIPVDSAENLGMFPPLDLEDRPQISTPTSQLSEANFPARIYELRLGTVNVSGDDVTATYVLNGKTLTIRNADENEMKAALQNPLHVGHCFHPNTFCFSVNGEHTVFTYSTDGRLWSGVGHVAHDFDPLGYVMYETH